MRDRFHSPVWYRLRDLAPVLHPQLEFALHDYRGASWVVLRNPFKGQVHRYPARLHNIIGALDGRRTLGAITEAALDELGADAPGQNEVVELISQLFRADLLTVPGIAPDLSEALERLSQQQRQKRQRTWKSPLFLPVHLFDPDRLLDALAPLVRGPVAGLVWVVLWLGVVIPALALLPGQLEALTSGGLAEWVSMEMLWQVALVYPVMKTLHELGHGLAVKRHGGEIHDCGVMFLVFYPVPYVDASAASFFSSQRARLLVGAAGILVELWLSALALLIWAAAEPGPLRDIAFATMLIGGVSTLIVNGNPLLRFDGYHILGDLVSVPNLSQQTSRWWGWLLRNALLRTRDDKGRARNRAEAWVFAIYGPASLVYRTFVMLAIAVMVASRLFIIGLALGAWSIWQAFGRPLLRILDQFRRDPALVARRRRAGWMAAGVFAALAAGLFVVPAPLWQVAEGVVWLPDDARIRVRSPGIVAALHSRSGAALEPGSPVLALDNPELHMARDQQAARLAQARLVAAATFAGARTDHQVALERERQEALRLDRAEARLADLSLVAAVAGTLYLPQADRLPGSLLREGDVAGYVVPAAGAAPVETVIRAAVPQHVAERIEDRLESVRILPVDGSGPLAARLVRVIPGATDILPSPALGQAGGGGIPTDPTAEGGIRALERVFVLDVAAQGLAPERYGGRVLVKFALGSEPIAWRIARSLRRSFLRHFAEIG